MSFDSVLTKKLLDVLYSGLVDQRAEQKRKMELREQELNALADFISVQKKESEYSVSINRIDLVVVLPCQERENYS